MARIIILLAFVTITFPVLAGSGGPDAYGYTWKDNFEPDGPVFNWVDITTTGVLVTGLGDDNVVGPYVMETNMPFYWYNRKNVWIGSNGYIAFVNGNIASPFPTIPTGGGTNDYITGMMADLNFAGTGNPGQVWWHDDVDITIISYINVPFWTSLSPSYTGSNTFQIILNKVDSTITVQVLAQTGLTQNNDLTIGIESVAGNIGLQHSKNIYPGADYAIRYTPPPTPLITVSDATVDWNTAPGSGGLFRSKDGSAMNLVTTILNIGNENVNGFTVDGAVLDPSGTVLVSDQVPVNALVPEQDTTIIFAPIWSPTISGTHRFRTTISGISGELVTTNNVRIQEIAVVDTTTLTHDLRFHGPTDDGLGLSWTGGNGGVGVHIIPPYYPAQITHTTVRIVSNLSAAAYTMKVYRDDGPNGSAGTLLDSIYVPPAQATPGDHVHPLSAPVTLLGGGVYVLWYMQGTDITIAEDITPPFSLRTYEVLDNVWAEYRDRETSDFFLGVRLTQVPVIDVGVSSFFEPSSGSEVTGPTTVRVFIRNHGNQAVTDIPISYQYGTGTVVQETYTGAAIQPTQQVLFSFAQSFGPMEDATNNLCAWTDLDGDVDPENDTVCIPIETITSIADPERITLRIAPNPADQFVQLDGAPSGSLVLHVLDVTGRMVRQEQMVGHGGPIMIDTMDLPDGAYRFILRNASMLAVATVVVAH